jgi:hypothetical protein
MLKAFLFTESEMDAIYKFVFIAHDVATTKDEKDSLQMILDSIDNQSNFTPSLMKEFVISTPDHDKTDFVYADSEDKAILRWADEVGLTATQVKTR